MSKTTATTKRRIADKQKIERDLGLPEFEEGVTVEFTTPGGYKISESYTRIVFGDRGPYIEIEPKHTVWSNFECTRRGIGYFNKWYSPDGIMIYDQRRTVKYADYLPGMVYVSPYEVKVAIGSVA